MTHVLELTGVNPSLAYKARACCGYVEARHLILLVFQLRLGLKLPVLSKATECQDACDGNVTVP